MDASADELNDEFGASPLGKGPPGDGGSQPSLWPAVGRLPPLAGGAAEDVAPDIYSDLFGAGGEGSTLLKSQLVQVRPAITAIECFFSIVHGHWCGLAAGPGNTPSMPIHASMQRPHF